MPTVSSVTSVTAMHSVPDEKTRTSSSISLYTNKIMCCVMTLHAVVLEFRATEFYWGAICSET